MIESAYHNTSLAVLGNLERIARERHILLSAVLEPTRRCNLRCTHCYRVEESGRPELPTARLLSLLEELRGAGTYLVTFSGGECTLHPDFLRILRHASELKLLTQVFSNGNLITTRMAEAMAASNLSFVGLSIYGSKPETHDQVTRTAGSFHGTLRAAKLLKEHGVGVKLRYLVMKQNFAEFHAVRRMARRLNMECDADLTISLRDDGGRRPARHRMDDEQLRAITRYWMKREQSDLKRYERALGIPQVPGSYRAAGGASCPSEETVRAASWLPVSPPQPSHPRRDFTCDAGLSTLAITACGDVYPCVALPLGAGNVMERPVSELWEQAPVLRELRDGYTEKLESCNSCALAGCCPRCPGMAFTEGGDLYGSSPESCRHAKINFALRCPDAPVPLTTPERRDRR